jgi:hypothetical protein
MENENKTPHPRTKLRLDGRHCFSLAYVLYDDHGDRRQQRPGPLFNIQINSHDEIMVEGEVVRSVSGLRKEMKEFVLNNGRDKHSSENPEKAIISIKTDRGTSYKSFLAALDEVQAAYYEIYGQQAGVSASEFRKLDLTNSSHKKIYDKGRKGIPMNISIAESSAVLQ